MRSDETTQQLPTPAEPSMAQLAAARAFVEEFATVSTYGGGCEAVLKIGRGDHLRARDGWQGKEHALICLAEQLAWRFIGDAWTNYEVKPYVG